MSFSFTSFFCSDTNEVREPNKRRRERKHTTDKGKCTGFFVLCSSSFHWLVSCFLHSFSPLQTSQWKKWQTRMKEERTKWSGMKRDKSNACSLHSFTCSFLFHSTLTSKFWFVFYLFCLFCSLAFHYKRTEQRERERKQTRRQKNVMKSSWKWK